MNSILIKILLAKLSLSMLILTGMLYQLHPQLIKGISSTITNSKITTFLQSVNGTEDSKLCDDGIRYCYGYSVNHGTWSEEHVYFGTSSTDAQNNFIKNIQ